MKKQHLINIFGSSGSGSTTLAKDICLKYGHKFIDVDDFLWKKTDPPFTERYTNEEACKLIKENLKDHTPAVISGSLVGVCDELKPLISLFVYINLDKDIRIERIKNREKERFGERILPGGDLHEQHLSFLRWVSDYEENPETERSRRQHLLWLEDVKAPVLRVTHELSLEELNDLIKPFIRSI